MLYIYIGIFGLLGVFSRYFMGDMIHKYYQPTLPYDTFLINVIGSFLIGIIYVIGVEKTHISQNLRIGIMVGFLGGFTTFSSYCLDAFKLLEAQKYLTCLLYVSLSSVVGIFSAFIGIILARQV